MTDAYVTSPPKSMSLDGHYGFWAPNGPKWLPKKCQDELLTISVNNLRQKSHWQELRKVYFVT